jgi:hypothetical protein
MLELYCASLLSNTFTNSANMLLCNISGNVGEMMPAVIMIKTMIMIIEAATVLTIGANNAMTMLKTALTLTTITAAAVAVAEVRVEETKVTRHGQKEKKLIGTYLKSNS